MSLKNHLPTVRFGLSHLPAILAEVEKAKADDGRVDAMEAIGIAIKAVFLALATYEEDLSLHK